MVPIDSNHVTGSRSICEPCHLRKQHETGKIHIPIQEKIMWKLNSFFQNWDTLHNYAKQYIVSYYLHFTIIWDLNYHYVTALPSIYILSHDSVVHYCTINVCNIPTLNFL